MKVTLTFEFDSLDAAKVFLESNPNQNPPNITSKPEVVAEPEPQPEPEPVAEPEPELPEEGLSKNELFDFCMTNGQAMFADGGERRELVTQEIRRIGEGRPTSEFDEDELQEFHQFLVKHSS